MSGHTQNYKQIEDYKHHYEIEAAIAKAQEKNDVLSHNAVVEAIQNQIARQGYLLAPVENSMSADGVELSQFRAIREKDGDGLYIPVFTSMEQMEAGPASDYITCDIRLLLDNVQEAENMNGLAINPWTDGYTVSEEAVAVLKYNCQLHDAIHYATAKHAGQFRKGTLMPYIVHPLETMQILKSMNAGPELMMAGVLHDTLEDTDATKEELQYYFGDNVAELVAGHSEDKSKSWELRKETAIAELANADITFKMLVMADKVSNLRSILQDYKQLGDELWQRFNRPKEKQAWYYSKIQDALWDMQFEEDAASVYWEMVGLYKDIFVQYYYDEAASMIYQLNAEGDCYRLKKGIPQWLPLDETISDNAVLVERKDAERMEENWAEPFWQQHAQDMVDGVYQLHKSNKCIVTAKIHNENMAMVISIADATMCYTLDSDNTHRLLVQLRFQHGTEYSLEALFKKAFGSDDANKQFIDFCKDFIVVYEFEVVE